MDRNTFIRLLSFLESNNKQDTSHPIATSGPHKGTAAMSEFGLMPLTAQNIARNNPNKTELDKLIEKADPKTVEEILGSNPEKYEQYVNQYADKVLNKSNMNPEEAATRWLAGPNASNATMNRVINKNQPRMDKMEDFIDQNVGASEQVQPTYTEDLVKQIPPKEVLFNKIRNSLKGNLP